jgi:alkylhydroperoxidase family enzyme
MARIPGAPANQGGLLSRLFKALVYSITRRRLGRVIMPIQVTAHHPKLFWGYLQMEQSQMGSHLVDHRLKGLAELRVATLVGCPFWIDIGSAVGRKTGISAEQIANLSNYRTDSNFSKHERLVLEYADAMTQLPVEVSDDLFARLHEIFNETELVELTSAIAWENYRARFDHAFGIEAENFSEGAVCALPVRSAELRPGGTPEANPWGYFPAKPAGL